MQTFRASDGQSPNKNDYTPFLPEDAVVDGEQASSASVAPQAASIAPDSRYAPPAGQPSPISQPLVQQQPSSSFGMQQPMPQAQQPYVLPSQDGKAETFFYQPEHVYYPPTPAEYKTHHGGMDRRQFRSLIIGFLLLALAAFIFIIVFFGRRGSHSYFSQTQNIADIVVSQPLYEQVVAPPFQVIGKARGYWYDENGQFPVQVYDKKDNLVAYGAAIAQQEIDGDEFTVFQAIVHDYQFWPAKKYGYITLQRANAIPEMNTLYTIPIEFQKRRGSYVVGSPITTSGASSSGTTTNTSSNTSSGGTTTTTTTTTNTSGSGSSTTSLNGNSCGDGIDNDGDNLVDVQDPECHSDFNAFNFASYTPSSTETDVANIQPDQEDTDTSNGGSGTNGGNGTGNIDNTREPDRWVPAGEFVPQYE